MGNANETRITVTVRSTIPPADTPLLTASETETLIEACEFVDASVHIARALTSRAYADNVQPRKQDYGAF